MFKDCKVDLNLKKRNQTSKMEGEGCVCAKRATMKCTHCRYDSQKGAKSVETFFFKS